MPSAFCRSARTCLGHSTGGERIKAGACIRPVQRDSLDFCERVIACGDGTQKEDAPGDRRRVVPSASVLQFEAYAASKMPLAQPLAQEKPNRQVSDPDLARIVDAWPSLPAHVRQTILTLIGTAEKL